MPEAERLLDILRDGDAGLPRVLREAPWDDEPESEEERAATKDAYEDLRTGRVVSHEEARRRLLGDA